MRSLSSPHFVAIRISGPRFRAYPSAQVFLLLRKHRVNLNFIVDFDEASFLAAAWVHIFLLVAFFFTCLMFNKHFAEGLCPFHLLLTTRTAETSLSHWAARTLSIFF
jgi:hypothetical protein